MVSEESARKRESIMEHIIKVAQVGIDPNQASKPAV